jgi:hypothetical protein
MRAGRSWRTVWIGFAYLIRVCRETASRSEVGQRVAGRESVGVSEFVWGTGEAEGVPVPLTRVAHADCRTLVAHWYRYRARWPTCIGPQGHSRGQRAMLGLNPTKLLRGVARSA